ncbi:MAG: hypothetical protein ACMG51_10660, partial [Ginsengibacter sp.]
MKAKFTLLSLLFIFAHNILRAQIITTIAGGGSKSAVPATEVGTPEPSGVAVDLSGNIFFVCIADGSVRKIDPSGIITTVAGGGTGILADGGLATNGKLLYPEGIAVDTIGNLYITETDGHKIRKVSPSGIITTIAGTGVGGYSGDGSAATFAQIFGPAGIKIDKSGNIFFADNSNERIRKIDTLGIITTVAGNGIEGYNGDGIPATTASLNFPWDIAIDASNNIYITDVLNSRVRKVS